MMAFAVLSVATSFAFEVGDYATNATQRFKITGENLVTNGNFANARDGWFGADKETAPSADVWDYVEGAGPNGESVIQSIAATADQPFCNSWELAPGSYLVSYQVKAAAGKNMMPYSVDTNKATISVPANCADFFINSTGELIRVLPTDEAPVTGVASMAYVNDEWRTVCYFFTIGEGQKLVMHFEKLDAETQFTNIEIHQAEQVYDVRIAQNRIALAKELMENENFNVEAAQEAKANLQGIIETIEGMIAAGEFDDQSNAEAMMEGFETEGFEPFLAVTSVDAKTLIPGLDIASLSNWGRGGIGSNSAKWHLLKDAAGNWGHLNTEQDVLRSAIQTGYAHSATYNVYHEDFPAGKYFFTCEIRNANTGKASWPTEPVFNLKTDSCLMFIGTDTIATEAIEGEEFQRFSMVAEVKEDGGFYAGVYWPGVSSGGAFFIRNTIVRAFNLDIQSDVDHIQAFKTYTTQWDAATNGRQAAHNLVDNANYPWGQNELKAEVERLDPYYTSQRAKGWTAADGTDAGIASTEELNDWANYQGIEEYNEPTEEGAEPTRKTYQLVRGYQGAANAIKATNQIITDLGNAIEEAKKTRNTGAYLTGDRDTYKTAIQAALKTLKDVRATTTDATRVADSTTLDNALQTLNAATEAFLASVTNAPIVDIDFSKPFTEDTAEDAPAAYYIEGTAGRMYFGAYDEDNTSASGMALGYGEEHPEVLRLGNSSGTVYLNKELTDNDELTVKFDMWVGNLKDKNVYIDLRNANDKRVAGFSICRYNPSVAYNDFNDVLTNGGKGLNLLQYVRGKGKSGVADAAICADDNKSSFTLVVDYKGNTVKGSVISNGTCEGAALPMPAMEEGEDNKITKIVVGSNYNNAGRRSWFDNLTVSVSSSAADIEEDITEKTWADAEEWVEPIVDRIETVKAAADNAIYTIGGIRVAKASKPGMYIQNGKVFVVK